MIPGRRTSEGQLVITAGPPLSTDPRMAGFAMKPTGEIYASGGQSAFTPEDLFLNGEVGAWYDPSDLTTMFQDRAGTTPVTADGQTVGKILDKSGRGNHATAPSDAARPLYKTDGTYHWLQFDGVDDSLSTAAIDFTGNNKLSVFAGSGGVTGIYRSIVNNGGNATATSGKFLLAIPNSSSTNFSVHAATVTNGINAEISGATAKNVTMGIIDTYAAATADKCKIRNNGVYGTNNVTSTSGSPIAIDPLYIGASNVNAGYFIGNIYSLIVRGALSTPEEIDETETWVNSKTGAY